MRDVTVTIESIPILSHVDVLVGAGEWVGLIGPNGAGKSTLLRLVVGTVPSQKGSVKVGEVDLEGMNRSARARLVALVPQRPQIPPAMTVFEYALLGRTPYLGPLAVEGRQDIELVRDSLTRLHLDGMAGRSLGTLSGGELQRAILARALAQRSPILLLDEPTTALDLGHQQQVMAMVEEMRRVDGITILSALHDLTAAAQFCDRLVLLSGGRKVMEGPPGQVLSEDSIGRYFGATVQVITGADGKPVVVPSRSGPPVASVSAS